MANRGQSQGPVAGPMFPRNPNLAPLPLLFTVCSVQATHSRPSDGCSTFIVVRQEGNGIWATSQTRLMERWVPPQPPVTPPPPHPIGHLEGHLAGRHRVTWWRVSPISLVSPPPPPSPLSRVATRTWWGVARVHPCSRQPPCHPPFPPPFNPSSHVLVRSPTSAMDVQHSLRLSLLLRSLPWTKLCTFAYPVLPIPPPPVAPPTTPLYVICALGADVAAWRHLQFWAAGTTPCLVLLPANTGHGRMGPNTCGICLPWIASSLLTWGLVGQRRTENGLKAKKAPPPPSARVARGITGWRRAHVGTRRP